MFFVKEKASKCRTGGQKPDHQCKLLWAWPSSSTLQTTACAKEYMHTMVEDKDHQRKLQRVKNYTATIGVHDAASTCNLHKGMPLNFCPYPQFKICIKVVPLCKLHLVAASCSYTCAHDGVDTVQLALVVFSFHQLAKILHLQSWSSSPAATCAGGVFPGALAHLLMCAQTNRHTLQLALCGCGCLYITII